MSQVPSSEIMKREAARAAVALVTSGMRLGLGTGSTARHFVDLLGERIKAGLDVLCVATSEATQAQASGLGIPLTTLDEVAGLDMTVDGADEFDGELRLVKGGGGALLREKIVAKASRRMVVIADDTKLVATLGRFPLPVEVVRFGWSHTRDAIVTASKRAGCDGDVRVRVGGDGKPFETDGGNLIIDCAFGQIPDASRLADVLKSVTGVVEHGLFIGIAQTAFLADPNGVRRIDARTSRG